MLKNCAVVILAAGISKRMGFHKAFLKWNENQLFIEKIIETYQDSGINEIVVVINQMFLDYYTHNNFTFLQNCSTITNNDLEKGRFYSFLLGCKSVRFSNYTFIQNIDNPFINKELLNLMHKEIEANAIVVPQYKNQSGHPLLLGENVLIKAKQAHYKSYENNMRIFLQQFKKTTVNTNNQRILTNINTKEDYKSHFNFNN